MFLGPLSTLAATPFLTLSVSQEDRIGPHNFFSLNSCLKLVGVKGKADP